MSESHSNVYMNNDEYTIGKKKKKWQESLKKKTQLWYTITNKKKKLYNK